jgi:hypothetical protein
MRTRLLVLSLFIVSLAAGQSIPSAKSPLDGAWRLVEVQAIQGNGQVTVTKPVQSLVLFSGGYYSFFWTSQPSAATSWQMADSDRVARFNSSLMNAGTFKISGSTLETHADIALVPKFTGGIATFRFSFSRDTLVLNGTGVGSVDGVQAPIYASGGHVVNKLVRAH